MRSKATKLSSLSHSWQRLFRMMLQLNHGQLENVSFIDGQPVFNPSPLITRLRVFGRDNGPHAKRKLSDFVLNDQFRRLVREIGSCTGRARTIVVQDGLPIRVVIEMSSAS